MPSLMNILKIAENAYIDEHNVKIDRFEKNISFKRSSSLF